MSLTTYSHMAEDDPTGDGLRQKIEAAIAPWVLSDEPAYTLEQMVVMALLCADRPSTAEEIFIWIIDTFKFYRRLLTRNYTGTYQSTFRTHSRSHDEVSHLQEEFHDALHCFDIPVTVHESENKGRTWTLRVSEGEALLSHVLARQQATARTSFNFFGLPSELRATIYDMVFGYPKSGLHISRSHSRTVGKLMPEPRFRVSSRSYLESFDLAKWEREGQLGSSLSTMPMQQILAPLLTSKQFYNEAMPTFYRINHFHCRDSYDLYHFLYFLAPSRSRHLGHISVGHFPGCEDAMPKAFKLLGEVEHLRRFQFRFNEQEWLMTYGKRGKKVIKKYTSVKNIPGFSALRAIRGLEETTFVGPCPTLKDLLKVGMEEPKTEKKASKGAVKRKADDGEMEQTKGGKKKKKVAAT